MSFDFESIKSAVSSFESEKRFSHTLGVADEACRLGKIFLPAKVKKLRLAGLLHDITKDFKLEKQLELCEKYGIAVDTKNIVPKLLHAKTGCEFSREIFGRELVDDEVYSGIYYHTTGRRGMTLFEAIIYLADYIEQGRTFFDCVELRKFFYERIATASSYEEKIEVLRKTMVLSFDMTIKNLIEEGKQIDSDTVDARNYFLTGIAVFSSEWEE